VGWHPSESHRKPRGSRAGLNLAPPALPGNSAPPQGPYHATRQAVRPLAPGLGWLRAIGGSLAAPWTFSLGARCCAGRDNKLSLGGLLDATEKLPPDRPSPHGSSSDPACRAQSGVPGHGSAETCKPDPESEPKRNSGTRRGNVAEVSRRTGYDHRGQCGDPISGDQKGPPRQHPSKKAETLLGLAVGAPYQKPIPILNKQCIYIQP